MVNSEFFLTSYLLGVIRCFINGIIVMVSLTFWVLPHALKFSLVLTRIQKGTSLRLNRFGPPYTFLRRSVPAVGEFDNIGLKILFN